MSRLTEWMQEEHRAIPRMDLRSNGYEKCATRLAEYEDTGLTVEEVQELKERDTAKKPIKNRAKFTQIYECPVCGCKDVSWQSFCDECGQRLDWSDEDEKI